MAPNIVLLMADQLAAPALPIYGHPLVQAPAIRALAERGAVFGHAYCNSPICAPSRYSMLSGRFAHAIDAFDNASEFPAAIPTMAHYLRAAGYRTILCGKMHFVGPDQLHGFDERLTTDIYPAEFLWVPDWSKGPGDRPTGVSMRHVVEAGPCVRSMQMDYDEEVEHAGVQKVYDLARTGTDRPFFLTVSYTHPHPPFVAPQPYWDLYDPGAIDLPRVPAIPYAALDAHSQWLHRAHAQDLHDLTDERIRRARHGYYGMVSYVDAKIGAIVEALERTGLAERSVIVCCADHGEMLGERGMWYKQTFFEWSARVPLVIRGPGIAPRRVADIVSLVDLLPTFLDIAAPAARVSPVDPLDGCSLWPLLAGAVASTGGPDAERAGTREAIAEYASEGVCAPSRMLRRGRYKYVHTLGLPPLLFDLVDDPDERVNLAGRATHAGVEAELSQRLLRDWDPAAVDRRIRESQRRRLFLRDVSIRTGAFPQWSYEARQGDRARFVRPTATGAPQGAKPRLRFPYVEPVPPDRAPA
jgi:choline-sulfatase